MYWDEELTNVVNTDTTMFQSMRKDIKTSKHPEGNLILKEEKNNKEKELNGKKWYFFVMKDCENPDDPDDWCCPVSWELFDYKVSGVVLWFSNKLNRDRMYQWQDM